MEDAEYAVYRLRRRCRTPRRRWLDMARREGPLQGRPDAARSRSGRWLTGRSRTGLQGQRYFGARALNYGQYVLEVERVVAGQVPVALYAKYDNEPATPAQLLAEIHMA